jgi:hypothetical protein
MPAGKDSLIMHLPLHIQSTCFPGTVCPGRNKPPGVLNPMRPWYSTANTEPAGKEQTDYSLLAAARQARFSLIAPELHG